MNLLIDYPSPKLVKISLNKPEKHNAFDEKLIQDLTRVLQELDQDQSIRAILLAAKGPHFSAGADIEWMQRMMHYSQQENLNDALGLAHLLHALNTLSKPTIGLIQGGVYGGGVGLVACCDIAIANEDASFCLSEVKLGLIPAVISPYVVAAMGARACRRYFLTAERFNAQQALQLGLIHQIAPTNQLLETGLEIAATLLHNSPQAIKAAKKLLLRFTNIDETLIQETAQLMADIRISEEAQIGLKAFLAKRK